MLILDEQLLILFAVGTGLSVAIASNFLARELFPGSMDRLVPWVLMGGQALLACWTWVAFGKVHDSDGFRRSVLRYEFGWIALFVGVSALGLSLWRIRRPLTWQRIALCSALLGFVGSQAFSSWMAELDPRVDRYAPIILIILSLTMFPLSIDAAVDAALLILGTVCLVSLLTIPFDIPWNEIGGYRRIPAPFLDGRLRGVLSHPNVLAPLAALGLVLTVTTRRWNPRWLLIPVFALTLWLTDGRTQIFATCAVLAGMALMVVLRKFESALIRRGVVAAIAVIAAIGILVVSSGSGPSELETLNGRTRLWEDALEYWKSSPIYGVGPAAFDAEYRFRTGLVWAYGAHNQILQTLAADGIVGVVFLAAAMMVFVSVALSAAGRRKVQLSAVCVIGFATMMVETPLWLEVYLPEWFAFISVLVILFSSTENDAGRCDGKKRRTGATEVSQ